MNEKRGYTIKVDRLESLKGLLGLPKLIIDPNKKHVIGTKICHAPYWYSGFFSRTPPLLKVITVVTAITLRGITLHVVRVWEPLEDFASTKVLKKGIHVTM